MWTPLLDPSMPLPTQHLVTEAATGGSDHDEQRTCPDGWSPFHNGTVDPGINDPASGMLDTMTTSAGPRRHLATSPFPRDPDPIIETYAMNDLVCHDAYGMGRVINVEASAVTVDFRSQTVRITSPFDKMARL